MIAERPFLAQRLLRVNVTFDDEVGVGGNFQVVGLAFDQFDGFLAEITGEQKFVQPVGQRRGGGEGEHGIAAEENADGHARAGFVIAPAMPRADFLQLPVHAGGAVVVNLDAIHADVALAGVGVFGHDARQRDETAAVQRPAFLDGKVGKSRVEASLTVAVLSGRMASRRQAGGRLRSPECPAHRPRLFARWRRVEFVDHFLARAALSPIFGFAWRRSSARPSSLMAS